MDKFVLRIVRCSGCGAGIWCWIILGCPSPATFVTQRGHQRGPFPFAADPAGAHRYRSIALIEIAEAIEALLQVLRTSSLLLPNGRARDESTPAEVRHAVVRPSWPSKATAKLAVGVYLYHCDPGVDFAARALSFDVCARILPAKSEILRSGGQGRDKRCD